jgi:hypothetical protein
VENAREGDQDEVIYYLAVNREEALEMLKNGEIRDAKTMIGIYIFLEDHNANLHCAP